MDREFIKFEVENQVAKVILNRPPANALDLDLVEELHRLLDRMEGDSKIRVVVFLSDLERAFIAGADIKMIQARDGEELVNFMEHYVSRLQAVNSRIEALSKPTLAVINGHALGGGLELALACDFRFMSRGRGTVGLPEANIGLFAAAGGTQRLTRLVGKGKALELMIIGKPLSADEALRIGLVHRVFETEKLREESLAFAADLARRATRAVAAIKKCIRLGLNLSLDEGLKIELREFLEVLRTHDAREGLDAFVEKRKALFRGI